ncbi:restriction endonuclease subunit S [Echinicola shivajiensis]|uniref:restriction endonuclease subunit S n=1 Tax=Echinicola shivajiensis TaxID=1035916 RepID=UPI001BFC9B87|nr:restriction endonuclease subunit S [Echinicola shivajiensis]
MEVVEDLKYKKYAAYKDSGVEWLGEIPKGWDAIRMKFLFRDISIKNKPDEELLSVTQDKGVVPRTLVENRMVMPSGNLESFKYIQKGDFAISLRSFEGGLEYCHHDGIISPAYTVLKKKDGLVDRYYKYLFKSSSFISEIQTSVVGIREGKNISYPELSYSLLPIPKKEEQTVIANFLDEKTAKIDKAIAQKERLIQLLKERKQIIIQELVTGKKVWNAEKNAWTKPDKVKDSGIDWIGEIPEGWEVKKIRHVGETQNGISAGAEYFGKGFPFVTYGDVYSNIQLPKSVSGLAMATTKDQENYSVVEGDVFFTRTSETIDEVGFSSVCFDTIKEATFAGFLIRFRPKTKKLYKGFSKYYFSSRIQRNYFEKEMNLVTRASLSQELLKNLPVLLPPLNEQNQIFIYIEEISLKIDKSISLQDRQIEKLKEYKSVLIDSAVTGKIKVV